MKISVIVCAAGKGERAGFGFNKLLYPLYGAPVLYHTLSAVKNFLSHLNDRGDEECETNDEPAELIITSSPQDMAQISAICAPFGGIAVEGGETRTESVYNALKHVTGDAVLIHDGARPFTAYGQFSACLDFVKKYKSAITAYPATDTVYLSNDGWAGDIPQRSEVFNVQTPQGFLTAEIKAAYEKAVQSGEIFTDDGSVYSRYIRPARLCPYGDASAAKLTYKHDFYRQDSFAMPVNGFGLPVRCGFGVDVHAFGKAQSFVMLCGVKVPCDTGLIAHSDGDVALHAACDAVLSAAGLGDIGHYFPDDDPVFKDADSARLLKTVVSMINERGYKVSGLSVAIQAEKPRLAPHIGKMKRRLSEITGADEGNIGISAGTCEGLGFVGERRGICVYCVATLARGENHG